MFFIFGFFLGAIFGIVAQLLLGVPVLLAKGLGLLWGDRRIWWLLVSVVAIAMGLNWAAASHGYREVTDNLQKGYVTMQNAGVFGGVGFGLIVGLIILWRWGWNWKDPLPVVSHVLGGILLLGMAVGVFHLQGKPAQVNQRIKDEREAWITAIKTKDLATLRDYTAEDKGEWRHLPELGNDPIGYAINSGDFDYFFDLLRISPDRDKFGIEAAKKIGSGNNQSLARRLVEEYQGKPEIVANLLNSAIFEGNRTMYDFLFAECKADANSVTTQSALMMAAAKDRFEMAKDLLERGADVNHLDDPSNYIGETALTVAIHTDHPKIFSWLIKSGADVDLCHPGSYSPLMRAAKLKKMEMIQELVDAGANVNYTDKDNATALHLACSGANPDLDIAKILLDAGADPMIQNNRGFFPAKRLPPDMGGVDELPEKSEQ